MHQEILTEKQLELLPLIQQFKDNFYLVGGTALALQIGHRRSIDFDLFTFQDLDRNKIEELLKKHENTRETLRASDEELTLVINEVKLTFYQYRFELPHEVWWGSNISMPTILDIAAMKAYAMGRRAKWKDYVDMYFIFRDHFSLHEVSERARQIFKGGFNEKLLREQLCYFEDVNMSEVVDYMGEEKGEKEIKDFLIEVVTEKLS